MRSILNFTAKERKEFYTRFPKAFCASDFHEDYITDKKMCPFCFRKTSFKQLIKAQPCFCQEDVCIFCAVGEHGKHCKPEQEIVISPDKKVDLSDLMGITGGIEPKDTEQVQNKFNTSSVEPKWCPFETQGYHGADCPNYPYPKEDTECQCCCHNEHENCKTLNHFYNCAHCSANEPKPEDKKINFIMVGDKKYVSEEELKTARTEGFMYCLKQSEDLFISELDRVRAEDIETRRQVLVDTLRIAKQDLKQKLIGEVAKERKSNDKRYKSGYYQWNKEGYFATIQTLDEVLDIIGKI